MKKREAVAMLVTAVALSLCAAAGAAEGSGAQGGEAPWQGEAVEAPEGTEEGRFETPGMGMPLVAVVPDAMEPMETPGMETPVETAPVETPDAEASIETAPVEPNPMETPIEAVPVEPNPTEAPIETIPVETLPMETPPDPGAGIPQLDTMLPGLPPQIETPALVSVTVSLDGEARFGEVATLRACVYGAQDVLGIRWEVYDERAAEGACPWMTCGEGDTLRFVVGEDSARRVYRAVAVLAGGESASEGFTLPLAEDAWGGRDAPPAGVPEGAAPEARYPETFQDGLPSVAWTLPALFSASVPQGRAVPIQSEPGGEPLAYAEAGESVDVLAIDGAWALVSYGGTVGYAQIDRLRGALPGGEDQAPDAPGEPAAQPEEADAPMRVAVFSTQRENMLPGETVCLTSEIEGFEDYEVLLQWQCDRGAGFEDVPGANEESYEFTASAETLQYGWRLMVYYR